MGFFSSDTIFTARELKYGNFKYSKVMKDLLADKDVADILDKGDEKKVFYDKMKEVASRTPGGRLTRNGLREVLGYFRSGRAANIHPTKEAIPLAQKIAKKFLPAGTRRYVYRKENNIDSPMHGRRFTERFSPGSAVPDTKTKPFASSVKPMSGMFRSAPPPISRPISAVRRFPSRPAF